MTKFVVIAFTAAALVQAAAFAFAGDNSTDARPRTSSFVPHPHTNHHVYGAPMQPAVVGHSNVAHHKHTLKKRASSTAKN